MAGNVDSRRNLYYYRCQTGRQAIAIRALLFTCQQPSTKDPNSDLMQSDKKALSTKQKSNATAIAFFRVVQIPSILQIEAMAHIWVKSIALGTLQRKSFGYCSVKSSKKMAPEYFACALPPAYIASFTKKLLNPRE